MEKRKKTGGRVAGTPNATSAKTKEILQKIVGEEILKLGNMLSELSANERVNAIAKLLPYILPKQSENTLKGDPDNPIVPVNPSNLAEVDKRIDELIKKYNDSKKK